MRFLFWISLVFTLVVSTGASAQSVVPGAGAGGDTGAETGSGTEPVAVDALIEALEDPEARAQLIEALRNPASQGAPASPAAPAAEVDEEPESLAARAALSTQTFISDVFQESLRVVRDIGRLSMIPEMLTGERLTRILDEGLDLLLTIAATVAVYQLFRTASRRIHARRLNADGSGDTISGRIIAFVGQVVLRFLSVLMAWVVGYILGTSVFSQADGIALSQALYLNAFLLVGLFSIILSVFVSHYREDFTFADLPHRAETTVYLTIRRTFGLLTYGLVAVAPIALEWFNFVAARSLRTTIVTVGALGAIYAVARISAVLRRERAAEARARAEADRVAAGEVIAHESTADADATAQEDGLAGSIAVTSITVWDRIWPWFGYGYVAVAYGVAITNPNQMVELVGQTTLFSALGLISVLFANRLFQFVSQPGLEMPMPGAVMQVLPPLQARFSAFLPAIFLVSGVILLISGVLLVLNGWRIIDLNPWLAADGADFLWQVASIGIIAIAVLLAWSVVSSWIDTRLAVEETDKALSARSRTLLSLFRNALAIALVVFGGLTVLSELGIDIAPLLAGAGVIGLAIGFGAQKLVQDIITGVFIQLENAINEGDVVTVAGVTGAVEKLSIRSVALRDLSGVYHLIPFSAVDTVSNFMRRFAYHVEVVGIAYDASVEDAEAAMRRAFDRLYDGPFGTEIIAPLEWHGVISLGDSAVNLRARIKTKPGQQWGVGRAYTALVKKELDAAGVEIPFPHRELRLPKEMIDRFALPPST